MTEGPRATNNTARAKGSGGSRFSRQKPAHYLLFSRKVLGSVFLKLALNGAGEVYLGLQLENWFPG